GSVETNLETKLYKQGEVNRIFSHIPVSTLLYWAKLPIVSWSSKVHDGRGMHRLYSRDDLYVLGLVEELVSLNFPLDFIQKEVTIKFFFTFVRTTGFDNAVAQSMEKRQARSISNLQDRFFVVRKMLGGRKRNAFATEITKTPGDLLDSHGDIATTVIRLSAVIRKVDEYIAEAG
ncbi:MAG: MerR family transcriptional regulator, partial [Syntrophobacteraceae bacterium]